MDPLTNTLRRERLRENIERYGEDQIVPLVRLSRGGAAPPSPLDRAAVMARREAIHFESCLHHLARTLAKIARAFPGTIMSEDDLVDITQDPVDADARGLSFESEHPLLGSPVKLMLIVEGANGPQGLVQWPSANYPDLVHYWAAQLGPDGERVADLGATRPEEEECLLDYFIRNGRFQGRKLSPDDDEIPTGLLLEIQWTELQPLRALSRTFQRGLRAAQKKARRERSADPRARRAPRAHPGARRAQSAGR